MKWIWMALLGMVAVDCYTAEASDMPIHTDLSADSGAAAVADQNVGEAVARAAHAGRAESTSFSRLAPSV